MSSGKANVIVYKKEEKSIEQKLNVYHFNKMNDTQILGDAKHLLLINQSQNIRQMQITDIKQSRNERLVLHTVKL